MGVCGTCKFVDTTMQISFYFSGGFWEEWDENCKGKSKTLGCFSNVYGGK